MNKLFTIGLISTLIFTSCGPSKELLATQEELKETKDLLNSTAMKLNVCLSDKAAADASLAA